MSPASAGTSAPRLPPGWPATGWSGPPGAGAWAAALAAVTRPSSASCCLATSAASLAAVSG
eukprot:2426546-Pyramimonas_sp.AAC.1